MSQKVFYNLIPLVVRLHRFHRMQIGFPSVEPGTYHTIRGLSGPVCLVPGKVPPGLRSRLRFESPQYLPPCSRSGYVMAH